QSFLKGWVVRFLKIYNFSHGAGGGVTYHNIGKILVSFGSIYFSLELYHLIMLGKIIFALVHFSKAWSKSFPTNFLIFKALDTQSLTKLPAADLKRLISGDKG
ncbi:hypothetical protein ACJX0J_020724, partial [Zea mays]